MVEGFLYRSLGELSLVTRALKTCLTRESPTTTHVRFAVGLASPGGRGDPGDELLSATRGAARWKPRRYSLGLRMVSLRAVADWGCLPLPGRSVSKKSINYSKNIESL